MRWPVGHKPLGRPCSFGQSCWLAGLRHICATGRQQDEHPQRRMPKHSPGSHPGPRIRPRAPGLATQLALAANQHKNLPRSGIMAVEQPILWLLVAGPPLVNGTANVPKATTPNGCFQQPCATCLRMALTQKAPPAARAAALRLSGPG